MIRYANRRHCWFCVLYEWSRSLRSILPRRLTSRLFITSGTILYASVHVRRTSRMLIVEPRCCFTVNISAGSFDADEASHILLFDPLNSFIQLIKPRCFKRQVRQSSAAYIVSTLSQSRCIAYPNLSRFITSLILHYLQGFFNIITHMDFISRLYYIFIVLSFRELIQYCTI